MTRAIILAASLLAMTACASTQKSEEPSKEETAQVMTGDYSGTGTITYQDFEGGFFGIVGDDGNRFDVGRLDEAFQVDGMRVRYVLNRREGVMSTRMWGRIVEIVHLEAI